MTGAARTEGGAVVFGMDSAFSRSVFAKVCEAAPDTVRALVLRSQIQPGFPAIDVAGSRTIVGQARRFGVRVIHDRDDRSTAELLGALGPDFILVACYPRLVPRSVRDAARTACLNLHPSLLPRYRGPAPLFWQLRAGEGSTGVTLHRLESRLDAGDVAARQRVALPEGARADEIEELLGRTGGSLFVTCRGDFDSVSFEAQDESSATCQSFPGIDDYRLSADWPVRRAWNFLRGVGDDHTVFEIDTGTSPVRVRAAMEIRPGPADRALARDGDSIEVAFSGGIIRAIEA